MLFLVILPAEDKENVVFQKQYSGVSDFPNIPWNNFIVADNGIYVFMYIAIKDLTDLFNIR